ncbi:hypothetical protein PG996_002545 [Apiospora saccharicola]|uniref:Uncharacterized protein n=1 Tax=Apiospora saccharicola TaxID=335842 RepID=A0ABR1WNT4_9PEZI
MPPRKSVPRVSLSESGEDIDVDDDFSDIEGLKPPVTNAATLKIMNNISGVRCDFQDVRRKKQQQHAEKLADLEKRFTKRAEEDKYKQETHVRELLERLDQAIQKKMACEEAMMQVVNSVKQDTEAFQLAISSIYAERIQQCEEGIAMAEQAQEDGIPLMEEEKRQRARMEKLME